MTANTHANENSNKARYEECIVAFLDILGFKNNVLNSQNDLSILENIVQSLKIVNAIPSGGKKVSNSLEGERTIKIRSRFFSDSLVFFLRKKPEDIAHLFFIIRYLQDQLWHRGICLRGSINLGEMYWTREDDNVTVGKGLIDAYETESTIAIYPRIIVSEELHALIEHENANSVPFGDERVTSLNQCINKDADGLYFLDLLNPRIRRAEDESLEILPNGNEFSIRYTPYSPGQLPNVLQSIDKIIEDNINTRNAKAKQKYSWLKTYRGNFNG